MCSGTYFTISTTATVQLIPIQLKRNYTAKHQYVLIITQKHGRNLLQKKL